MTLSQLPLEFLLPLAIYSLYIGTTFRCSYEADSVFSLMKVLVTQQGDCCLLVYFPTRKDDIHYCISSTWHNG